MISYRFKLFFSTVTKMSFVLVLMDSVFNAYFVITGDDAILRHTKKYQGSFECSRAGNSYAISRMLVGT